MLNKTGSTTCLSFRLGFALLLTFFSLNVMAQVAACNKPSVFYVNGVNTSPSASTDGAKELTLAISEKFPQYGATVEAIWNPSEGLLGDLTEVAVTQHWLRARAEFLLAVVSGESDAFARFLQKELDDVAAIFRRIDAIEKVKAQILLRLKTSSAPVVLIAHSQGNIIVNEAVRQLKTSATTANISGVKTIAILGIASADKLNMPLLLEQGANINLYRHITSDTDLIMKLIQGNPPPNFFSTPTPFPPDILGHKLIDVYLDKKNLGKVRNNLGVLQDTNARSVVAGLFDEVYRNAAQAWPCFTLSSTPSPSAVGQEVAFSVKANDRLSGEPLAGQAISLASGDVTSPTFICSATLNANGNASCRQTFIAPARTEKVWINYRPVALPGFMSDYYFQGITAPTSHWAGSFKTTSCTPLPADADGNWVWEYPCNIHGPVYFSNGGYFYFDDSSSNVVFGDIVGNIQNVRRVLPLGWKSTDNTFSLSIPTTFNQMITDREVTRIITGSGNRTTSFTVLKRSTIALSGTYVVNTQSGYKAINSASYDWRIIPTTASGTWTASLINSPTPTFMNGFDFCFLDNSAANQMTSFMQANPVLSPAWATPYTTNGCRFQ